MRTKLTRIVHLAALCGALAACQPARPPSASGQSASAPAQPQPTAANQVPIDGIGYIIFSADVTDRSRDLLIANIGHLLDAGATTIDIAINSRGGSTDAAVAIYDYMAREHAARGTTFAVYNVGLVASAASYIFLGAQRRYAGARAGFVFHAAGFMLSRDGGLVSAQQLRDRATEIEAYERLVRAALKAHTHLTPSEIQTYITRTVILSADDARRDGVIDAIADFRPPPGAVISAIRTRANVPPRLFPEAPN